MPPSTGKKPEVVIPGNELISSWVAGNYFLYRLDYFDGPRWPRGWAVQCGEEIVSEGEWEWGELRVKIIDGGKLGCMRSTEEYYVIILVMCVVYG